MVFKRTQQDDESIIDKIFSVIDIPLNFFRDYTVPMADVSEWNRLRAAIVPLTMPFAFFYLQGMLTTGDDSLEGDA